MDIKSILDSGRSVSAIIADLKKKSVDVPLWEKLEKDYEPEKHKIVEDKVGRVDKIHKDGTIDKAARIHIGLEKLLCSRMTEFTFAIEVKRNYPNVEDDETKKQISRAIEAVYKNARIDNENLKRGEAYYASCEIMTIWYAVKKENNLYGFKSKYKLKCKTFSPMDEVKLYPLFDDYDDMIAMSYEYRKKVGDEWVNYFETFTADRHYKWSSNNGQEWESIVNSEEVIIMKIPCSYLWRQKPVYGGLSHIREELEYTLSRNSDVIAYNSAPILKISGGIQGDEQKGETRRIYRVTNGGDVSYVSWAQSVESLKYQVETLLNMFFMQAQMPDISFKNMMSLGNIGYDARMTLLMDAHLKIGDESGAWVEFFERECNVIKAFLEKMNTSWAGKTEDVVVEHVISPFIQNDEVADINKIMKMNGEKPLISHLESIRMAGYATDPDKSLEEIKADEQAGMSLDINEHMFQ